MIETTIGETAGKIWEYLNNAGDSTIAKLRKEVDADTFTVSAAIGWLAREDKITLSKKGNSVQIFLRK
ncbi:MAG: hypothetical protein DWQ05_04850 [Calditrichaeota bacterium]|nr:MAG: hypothetical protein DWQ05_04850 [Calditrichota bacterium]